MFCFCPGEPTPRPASSDKQHKEVSLELFRNLKPCRGTFQKSQTIDISNTAILLSEQRGEEGYSRKYITLPEGFTSIFF